MKAKVEVAMLRTLCAIACALAMATAAADAEVGGATTTPPQSAPGRIATYHITSLENAFWACDYLATTRGTSATPTEYCAAVYDEIKVRKFDGDFDRLLAWWQANKVVAHQELTGTRAVRPETAPHATFGNSEAP